MSPVTILALSGDDLDAFIITCNEYLSGHCWQAMETKPEQKKVMQALMTLAAIFGEHGEHQGIQEDIDAASELFTAAKADDVDAVKAWHRNHAPFSDLMTDELSSAAKAVASHTASYFRR